MTKRAKMRLPRPTRTDEELRTASDRIYYCADQMLGLVRRHAEFAEMMRAVQQGQATDQERRCGNAHLESFLLHARSLLKFFDDADPRSDDVVVGDFFGPNDQWGHRHGASPSIGIFPVA
jgi:hypothetical protein